MAQQRLTREQEFEFRTLLTQANVKRMRKQWLDAETACREALSISPNDVVARDMLVGILAELGKTDQAISEAKAALEIAPGNVSLEKKYARLVFQKGEEKYQMALAQDMLEHPQKYAARARKPAYALFAALILPGLGQIYNEEVTKAAILFSTVLLFFASYALFQTPYPPNLTSVSDFLRLTNSVVLIFGIILTAAYIYGITDAVVTASNSGKEKEDIRKLLE